MLVEPARTVMNIYHDVDQLAHLFYTGLFNLSWYMLQSLCTWQPTEIQSGVFQPDLDWSGIGIALLRDHRLRDNGTDKTSEFDAQITFAKELILPQVIRLWFRLIGSFYALCLHEEALQGSFLYTEGSMEDFIA